MRGSDGGGSASLTTAVIVVVTIEMLSLTSSALNLGCGMTSSGDVTSVVVVSPIVVDKLGSYPPSVVVPL